MFFFVNLRSLYEIRRKYGSDVLLDSNTRQKQAEPAQQRTKKKTTLQNIKLKKKTKSGSDDSGSTPDRLRIDSGSALVNAGKKQKVVQNDSGSALVNGSKKQKVVQNDSGSTPDPSK